MDIVRYRVIVSLDELVALKSNSHMRDETAFEIRQFDRLTGSRLSSFDLFNVHNHVLNLPILDHVPSCGKFDATKRVFGYHFNNLMFRHSSPCVLYRILDASAICYFHRLISKGGWRSEEMSSRKSYPFHRWLIKSIIHQWRSACIYLDKKLRSSSIKTLYMSSLMCYRGVKFQDIRYAISWCIMSRHRLPEAYSGLCRQYVIRHSIFERIDVIAGRIVHCGPKDGWPEQLGPWPWSPANAVFRSMLRNTAKEGSFFWCNLLQLSFLP